MWKKWESFPNWHFEVSEVSYGVYNVKARHALGPTIEMTGTDGDKLVAEVKAATVKMELEIERKVTRGKS
jgi:hypothetical protein